MRVIAGKARRLLLKTMEGKELRPTTDRIKETLFNMINQDLPGCFFLDLFAGSGEIGIEALSRGAKLAVFMECDRKAAECIRENLETTKLLEEGVVMNCDALTGLKRLEDRGYVFDFVFMDPPYKMDLERPILKYLSESRLISQDTVLIVEEALDEDFDYVASLGYRCKRVKFYRSNKHVFLALDEENTGGEQ